MYMYQGNMHTRYMCMFLIEDFSNDHTMGLSIRPGLRVNVRGYVVFVDVQGNIYCVLWHRTYIVSVNCGNLCMRKITLAI